MSHSAKIKTYAEAIKKLTALHAVTLYLNKKSFKTLSFNEKLHYQTQVLTDFTQSDFFTFKKVPDQRLIIIHFRVGRKYQTFSISFERISRFSIQLNKEILNSCKEMYN